MSVDPHDEVKRSIRMTADRLLLAPSNEAGERKSRAGILIPATANVDRRLVWAEVVAAGPTVRTIEVGDRVLFSPDTGYEVEIRGEDYLILRERDVRARDSVDTRRRPVGPVPLVTTHSSSRSTKAMPRRCRCASSP
jgi:chaperonin GroES